MARASARLSPLSRRSRSGEGSDIGAQTTIRGGMTAVIEAPPIEVARLRPEPPPLHGGPLTFLRFARAHGMLNLNYLRLAIRWAWLKARWRGRLETDGLCFIGPGVKFEIGRDAKVRLGRWSWIGHGTKIRAHEGVVSIGAKSVLGQECTISSFQ